MSDDRRRSEFARGDVGVGHEWNSRTLAGAVPRRGETLSRRVADQLEGLVLRRELQPGEDLPTEAQLGEHFSVSRTVIREAIQKAEARGLVTVRQGIGARVTMDGREAFAHAMALALARGGCSMGDVLAFRKLVEPEICAAAALHATSRDIGDLEDTLGVYAEALQAGARQQGQEAHVRFHQAVWHCTHNPVLDVLLDPLSDMILLSTDLPAPPGPVLAGELLDIQAHREILACIRAGDSLGSRRAMITDLTNISVEVDWSRPVTPEWTRLRLKTETEEELP